MFRPKLEAMGYRTKKNEEGATERAFISRSIESVYSPHEIDSRFNALFDKLSSEKEDSEDIMIQCGHLLGWYLRDEFERQLEGRLEIFAEVRSFAVLQGFLERQLIMRGGHFAQFLKHPTFWRAIQERADFVHMKERDLRVSGAEQVHSFIENNSKNEKVVFLGSELNLDVRHSIDVVVGKTEDPKAEHPTVDEIVLVQIKQSAPSQEEIKRVVELHKEYAEALKEFQGRAVGTPEGNQGLERFGKKMKPEDFMRKEDELKLFYESILKINSEFQEEVLTWDSFVNIANKHNCDPILFYIRLCAIDDSRLHFISKEFQRTALKMAQERVKEMDVPQEEFAKYNRIIRGTNHITSAKKIRSVIFAGGAIISDITLL